MDNRFRDALGRQLFAITVEVVAPPRGEDAAAALGPARTLARALAGDPRIAGLSVTDRVRSDEDLDAAEIVAELASASGAVPIVHLSGKDRIPRDHERAVARLQTLGLVNILCVTGDRLKAPPAGRRVPYLDSVDAIALVRRCWPDALVGGRLALQVHGGQADSVQTLAHGDVEALSVDVHMTILRAARNERVARLVRQFREQIYDGSGLYQTPDGRLSEARARRVIADHRDLILAILGGDPDEAVRVLERHLATMKEMVIEALRGSE